MVASTNEAEHTGGVTVGLETWVSIATLLGVATGVLIAIRAMGADLRKEIVDSRTEVKADIGRLDDRVARLDDRVSRLDDRVYALAVGLRPELEERAKGASSAR
jgi:hypothetical protein